MLGCGEGGIHESDSRYARFWAVGGELWMGELLTHFAPCLARAA